MSVLATMLRSHSSRAPDQPRVVAIFKPHHLPGRAARTPSYVTSTRGFVALDHDHVTFADDGFRQLLHPITQTEFRGDAGLLPSVRRFDGLDVELARVRPRARTTTSPHAL